MHLGEEMEVLGWPRAWVDECAGTAAFLWACRAQPTCVRGQGWEHMAPCTDAVQHQCQEFGAPNIWVRGRQPVQAGYQLTDLPRRTNR